jgi:hypothetical protein
MAEEKSELEIDDWLDDLENDSGKKDDAESFDELDQSDIDALLGEYDAGRAAAASAVAEEGDASLGIAAGGADDKSFSELDQSDIDSLLSGGRGVPVTDAVAAEQGDFAQPDSDDLFAVARDQKSPSAGGDEGVPSQEDVDQLFDEAGGKGLESVGFSQVADSADKSAGLAAEGLADNGFDDDEFNFGELPDIPDETTTGRGAGPDSAMTEAIFATQGTGGKDGLADLLAEATADAADQQAPAVSGGRKPFLAMPVAMNRKSMATAAGCLLLLVLGGYLVLGGRGEKEPAVPVSLQEKQLASRPVGQPGNVPPEVADAELRMSQDGEALSVELRGEDRDGDALRYEIVTMPRHGRLSGEAPHLTYLPGKDFPGEDSFAFRAHDGQQSSAPARVVILGPECQLATVEVVAAQQAPVGEITRPVSLVDAQDVRLHTVSTSPLVIDWKKIWARANRQPFGAGVKVEIVERQMQGTLSRLDQARHRYVPDRYFSGTEVLLYRFHQDGRKSRIREVAIQVALGDTPPKLLIAPLAGTYMVGESVMINASETRDDSPDTLRFRWEQIAGVPVSMEPMNEEGSAISFVVPSSFAGDGVNETVIRVTAIDRAGQRASRDIRVQGVSRRQSPLWGYLPAGE